MGRFLWEHASCEIGPVEKSVRLTVSDSSQIAASTFLLLRTSIFQGMSFVPSVTELILAELLYLQYEDEKKPIFLYVNSTGTTKGAQKLAYDTEAFAIYDTMRYVKPPIHTLCVGTAWGEAAMLLAAGEPGKRASLPSASIMIKEPIQLFRGQATDIDIKRQEVRNTKEEVVALLSKHTEHPKEKIAKDIQRPFYMSPEEAVDYNLIDEVLYAQNASDVVKMVTKVEAGL